MKTMKRTLSICIILLATSSLFAQQELMVSQYMFNGLFLNPAYAGSHKYWEATALHRSQWVSLDGAPTTQLIGIDGPVADEKIGLGAIVLHDQIGDTRQFEFSANGSYHLDLDSERKNRLSFGLRAGFSNYTARLDETLVFDNDDPVFISPIENEFIPKLGAGVYFYNPKFYVGLSVPTIFAADDNLEVDPIGLFEGTDDIYFENHMFLNAGYVYEISENLVLKPNVLIKYHPAAPLQADINANLLINQKFWAGVSYRTNDAIIGILEFNVTDQIRIGYAYDFTLSDLADYSNGSHEVMLGYNFGKEIVKMKSPRYF